MNINGNTCVSRNILFDGGVKKRIFPPDNAKIENTLINNLDGKYLYKLHLRSLVSRITSSKLSWACH